MIANQPKLEQIDIFVRAIYIGTYSTTLMAEFYNNVFFTILQVESLEEMAKSLGVFKTGRDAKSKLKEVRHLMVSISLLNTTISSCRNMVPNHNLHFSW